MSDRLKQISISNGDGTTHNIDVSPENKALNLTINGTKTTYDGSEEVNKTIYAPETIGKEGDNLTIKNGIPIWQPPFYYECDTPAGEAQKTIFTKNFTNEAGKHIFIKFNNDAYSSNTNIAITLVFDDTAQNHMYVINMFVNGNRTYPTINLWQAGDIVEFVHTPDGCHLLQIVNRNTNYNLRDWTQSSVKNYDSKIHITTNPSSISSNVNVGDLIFKISS